MMISMCVKKLKQIWFLDKNQKSNIITIKPESETIIHQLCKYESVSMPELLHLAKNSNKRKDIIRCLNDANVLRYDIKGSLKWHSQV